MQTTKDLQNNGVGKIRIMFCSQNIQKGKRFIAFRNNSVFNLNELQSLVNSIDPFTLLM